MSCSYQGDNPLARLAVSSINLCVRMFRKSRVKSYIYSDIILIFETGQRPGKKMNIFSDDDDLDDDDFADQINCFTGFFPMQPQVSPSRNKPLGELHSVIFIANSIPSVRGHNPYLS